MTSSAEEKERIDAFKLEREEKISALNKLKLMNNNKNKMESYVQSANEDTKNTIHVNKDWPNTVRKAMTFFEN